MAVGILLVGGMGTRLKPLTNEVPKPMLPIAGIPVTEHQLLAAKKAGITTVILATSYLSEIFTPYFGDGSKWGIDLIYAVEEKPLGTGGAIRNAAQLVDSKNGSDEFVIFNGDVLSSHSISSQLEFHRANNADVTLHLIDVADARAFGCVPTDKNGRVTAFLEKMDNPVTNSINAGCYVFSAQVIEQIPLGAVVSVERETFPSLVKNGRPIFGYHEQSYWLDIGTPQALFKGSRAAVGAEFLIGSNSQIGASSILSGGSSIGKNVKIGARVSISNSIIGDNVSIGDDVQIRDSFILHSAEVGDGAIIEGRYISRSENLAISTD